MEATLHTRRAFNTLTAKADSTKNTVRQCPRNSICEFLKCYPEIRWLQEPVKCRTHFKTLYTIMKERYVTF